MFTEPGIDAIQAIRFLAMLHVRRMTLDGLSDLTGISNQILRRICREPGYSAPEATWVRIAHILRCDKAWLLNGVGEPMNTPDGRLALAMAGKGWTPEDLHAEIKGIIPIRSIYDFLEGLLSIDERTSVHLGIYAGALGCDTRWLFYGSDPGDSSAVPSIKETIRLAEALKKALPKDLPVDTHSVALKAVTHYFHEN